MKIDTSQLEFIDKKLRNLLAWIERQTGLEPTITSLYRIDDSGVHGALPLRGVDLRCRNRPVGQTLVDIINSRWTYDHKRPEMKCAIIHGVGWNMHIHLQVHPNTRN